MAGKEDGRQRIADVVRRNGIAFVELWFTDALGFLRTVTVKGADIGNFMEGGIGIDGSSIAGFTDVEDSDIVAMPDPSTFRVLPWGKAPTARLFCDIVHPGGRPFAGDPRGILRRTLERAADRGYAPMVKPELEYFYLRDASSLEPLDRGGYFHPPHSDLAAAMRQETAIDLERLGVEVDFLHHEASAGQSEIEVKFTDPLSMADNAVTYRAVAKEVARRNGAFVTFMPKPFNGLNGSGMHVHMMLGSGGRNAFFDPDAGDNLSADALHFIGGLLHHARAVTAVTCQWVNSYKRLQPGHEAPVHVCWGRKNRSALVRIPIDRPGKEDRARVEYRAADPACNPYLMISVLVEAGLDGIGRRMEAPPPVERDIFEMSAEDLAGLGIESLPTDLGKALEAMEGSELVRRCLGDHTLGWFLRNRREEWEEYGRRVTDWEIERYLRLL